MNAAAIGSAVRTSASSSSLIRRDILRMIFSLAADNLSIFEPAAQHCGLHKTSFRYPQGEVTEGEFVQETADENRIESTSQDAGIGRAAGEYVP